MAQALCLLIRYFVLFMRLGRRTFVSISLEAKLCLSFFIYVELETDDFQAYEDENE